MTPDDCKQGVRVRCIRGWRAEPFFAPGASLVFEFDPPKLIEGRTYTIWEYDCNDLVDVREGEKEYRGNEGGIRLLEFMKYEEPGTHVYWELDRFEVAEEDTRQAPVQDIARARDESRAQSADGGTPPAPAEDFTVAQRGRGEPRHPTPRGRNLGTGRKIQRKGY